MFKIILNWWKNPEMANLVFEERGDYWNLIMDDIHNIHSIYDADGNYLINWLMIEFRLS